MRIKYRLERDIYFKFINPVIKNARWGIRSQVREEVSFTDVRIVYQRKLYTRGKGKIVDYIPFHKLKVPIASIEAKGNKKPVGTDIQQSLEYSEILQTPFVYTANLDSFLFHDKTLVGGEIETEIKLDNFPSPEALWQKYPKHKSIETPEDLEIVTQDSKVKPLTNMGSLVELLRAFGDQKDFK